MGPPTEQPIIGGRKDEPVHAGTNSNDLPKKGDLESTCTKILATSLDRKFGPKMMVCMATSLIEKDLDKVMNKDESNQELLEVIEQLNWHMNSPLSELLPPPTLNRINKSARIKKLIELRRRQRVSMKLPTKRLSMGNVLLIWPIADLKIYTQT